MDCSQFIAEPGEEAAMPVLRDRLVGEARGADLGYVDHPVVTGKR